MYTYKANVVSVYDGDTITVDIELGFDVHMKGLKIRLFGLNAPEVRGSTKLLGQTARDALRGKILGKEIILRTIEDEQEKYGRWLGIVEIDGLNVNQWMVNNGYATVAMYELSALSSVDRALS